ncbi:MAG: ribosome maturation factor RimP [Alphaproteobacteria bacterium]|nr:ribosome maturation factor RimP [Alphaproteobacteria bacterium]
MKTTPLEDKIAAIAAPVIEDLGFALHCVRVVGEGGAQNVQIMAENPATRNLGVDDAAKISRALSAALDVEDPVKGAYRLEISSPGIDRLLLNKKDFEDYKNFEAKIESTMPAENGQKKFRGRLQGMKDDNILLTTDQGDVEIPFATLAKAKLVLTDELIKATAKLQEKENGTIASC